MASFLIILAALPLVLLFFLPKLRSKKLYPLPPGPSRLPIIGNLHQLDNSDYLSYLYQLSRTYGPIFSLRLGLIQTIVISSAKMAKEVLKTKDVIFCSRPVLTGQRKYSYNNLDVVFSPYNDYWREMRKISIIHLLSSKRVLSFRPVREEEVFRLMKRISELASSSEPVNLSEALMTLTSSIICRVAFGKRYDEEGPERKRFHELIMDCEAGMASFYFADYFPFMGWVDKLNGSYARLEKNFKALDQFYQGLIDEHLDEKRLKYNQEDVVDILLQLMKDRSSPIDLTFDHIKAVLMNILFGGTDTTAGTLVWTMTFLIKNCRVLDKVQDELRKIIGSKGRVEEDDLPKFTYFKAVIKESMRLCPMVPLLVPHASMEKCIIDGYEIPANTLVYVNAWAIGRDPECWENPEEFYPERFMDSAIHNYNGVDFEMIPFGEGRRICPGMLLGTKTVELVLSNLLYSFNWELPPGVKGENVDTTRKPGILVHKKTPLCLVPKVYNYGKINV